MPLGKLVLKGGQSLAQRGVDKKKKKKKKPKNDATAQGDVAPNSDGEVAKAGPSGTEPVAFNYEKEFQFETDRANEGKARSTAWGVTYRAPPEILHGYNSIVKGDTYEERLDLRCAKKADRMCK